MADELYQPVEIWELLGVQVQCGTNMTPTAVATLRNNESGEEITDVSFGAGPVDAVYTCIDKIVKQPNELTEFLVQAVTEGIDANGDVTVRIEAPESRGHSRTAQGRPRRRLFSGRGVDTDIIVASTKAYLQALNKLCSADEDDAQVSISAGNSEVATVGI